MGRQLPFDEATLSAATGGLEALLLSRLLLHTDGREGVAQPLVADNYALWRGSAVLRERTSGGFMSYRMVCNHSDWVAAIAGLAGAMFDNPAGSALIVARAQSTR